MNLDNFSIGYIMGLAVGEGSFTGCKRYPAFQIKLHFRDTYVLEYVQSKLGGSLYKDYNHGGRNYSFLIIRGRTLIGLLPIFDEFLPQSYKREQYIKWKEKYSNKLAVQPITCEDHVKRT